MGLAIHDIKFLIATRLRGADFSSVATLGKQSLLVAPEDIYPYVKFADPSLSKERFDERTRADSGYATGVLEVLGAKHVTSFDASSYEGCSVVHDMNQELPAGQRGKYSAVIDGGTLEHVFNIPQALKNSMDLLAIGGTFVGYSPGNNYFGHGFYQFSAELFFRCFSAPNGFEIVDVYCWERSPKSKWYQIKDPRSTGERAEFNGIRELTIAVAARKISEKNVFSTVPQQSDYVQRWSPNDGRTAIGSSGKGLAGRVAKLRSRARRWLERRAFDPRLFEVRDPDEVLRTLAAGKEST